MSDDAADTVWSGKYLSVRRQGSWEYVKRSRGIGAAVVLALDGDHVILVEQHRVPLGARCLELPAGLIGDEEEGETDAEAVAARELEEETGYRADTVESLGRFSASPGMSAELFTLVRATGLTKVGAGGGVAGEDITVHRVALVDVPAFVAARREEGIAMDAKLLILLAAGML